MNLKTFNRAKEISMRLQEIQHEIVELNKLAKGMATSDHQVDICITYKNLNPSATKAQVVDEDGSLINSNQKRSHLEFFNPFSMMMRNPFEQMDEVKEDKVVRGDETFGLAVIGAVLMFRGRERKALEAELKNYGIEV